MSKEIITQKVKFLKGCLPEDTQWWTEKDWHEHNAYVERLKADGEYLKEDEVTIHYPKGSFDMFESKQTSEQSFKNFGILMPQGTVLDENGNPYQKLKWE